MTITIIAHTNDLARLIVSETRTTDADIAALVVAHLKQEGFYVTETHEG